MAYKPAETPLLAFAKTSARGVEVLLEQGYVRFELWTGRRAPKNVVAEAVLGKYESLQI